MRRRMIAVLSALALGIGGSLLVASPAIAVDFNFVDTPAPAPTIVDATTLPRTIAVSGVGTIADVNVTLDFQKVGETCDAPGTSWPFTGEIEFSLVSPAGTVVTLIQSYSPGPETYSGDGNQRVQVTLDDSAAQPVGVNGIPETGAFLPVQPLGAFLGEDPNGDWILNVADTVGSDPLCYFGATLTISDGTTPPGPNPPAPTPPTQVSTAASGGIDNTRIAAGVAVFGAIAAASVLALRRRQAE